MLSPHTNKTSLLCRHISKVLHHSYITVKSRNSAIVRGSEQDLLDCKDKSMYDLPVCCQIVFESDYLFA